MPAKATTGPRTIHLKLARILLPLSEDGESVDTILAGLFYIDD